MISLKPMIRFIPAFILMSLFSCKEPVPTKPEDGQDSLARFVLSTDNHKLTSLDLRIQWLHFIPPVPVTVFKNDDSLTSFYQRSADTTLTLTGLNPSTDYRLTVKSRFNPPTMATIETRTMDTTSHDFIWEIDTIGYRNITLSDGVIINENDMWVAGDIYPDSASYHDATHYGLAHWNGEKWTPEIVIARLFPDNDEIKGAAVIDGIILTNKNELFVSTGLALLEKNGNQWKERAQDIIDGKGFSKIWGNTSDNLYLYGSNGGLYHYNGSSLKLIPTNTNLDIVDVHGDYNPKTGEYELLALASTDASHLNGSKLLKIKYNTVSELSINGIGAYKKRDLWFFQGSDYWITGDGVYFKKNLSDSAWIPIENFPASNWVTADISGWSPNDLFIIQGDGHVLHFNGSTWKDFKTDLHLTEISIRQIFIQNNIILLLGGENNSNPKGIIIRGKRIN